MDEILLVRVLTVLVRAHDQLGEACFEQAAHDAILAVARRTQTEAERRTRRGQIVQFPIHRARKSAPDET